MINILKSGGLLMIPIIICGIIGTFIIIERCIYFFTIKKRDLKLMSDINEAFLGRDFEKCKISCGEAGTPLSQVLRKAFNYRNNDEKDLREIVESEMNSVVPKFEHLISTLGTIANIATLLGLLGTVTGNMKAFGVLGAGGTMGDPGMLAGAIAEALVTTVAGLCVSIPSLIFHNYFVSRVKHRIVDMESNVTEVLLKLSGRIR